MPNRLKRQSQSARDRAKAAAAQLERSPEARAALEFETKLEAARTMAKNDPKAIAEMETLLGELLALYRSKASEAKSRLPSAWST